MGCVSSTDSPVGNVDSRRRRLSIGKVDGPVEKFGDNDQLEISRGMLRELTEKNVMDIINLGKNPKGTTRRYSLGSQTDADLNRRSSFASKTVHREGDANDINAIGFACKKGLKPESPNQDSWCVIKVEPDFSIYAVFDGHGAKGHDISDFVRSNLPKVLLQSTFFHDDPARALTESYLRIQNMIEAQTKSGTLNATFSGSTVSVVLHRHTDSKMFVSHVGDSRCVLGRSQGGKIVGVPLTQDHKPNDIEERQRIESKGGRVVFDGCTNFRVYAKSGCYPGLNMSRALGDLMGYYEAGISAEPTLSEVAVLKSDKLLLVCSDGVWEFISDQEAMDIILPHISGKHKNVQKAADVLAREAWDRWMAEEEGLVVDDITVLVVMLDDDKVSSNGAT